MYGKRIMGQFVRDKAKHHQTSSDVNLKEKKEEADA